MTTYNKLVRDNIPEIIRSKGSIPVTHIANKAEYWEKLKDKLQEEVAEFAKDENEDELADILEVVDAIILCKGFDREHIQNIKVAKAKARGVFAKQIILESS